jgi:hypothetical protein
MYIETLHQFDATPDSTEERPSEYLITIQFDSDYGEFIIHDAECEDCPEATSDFMERYNSDFHYRGMIQEKMEEAWNDS